MVKLPRKLQKRWKIYKLSQEFDAVFLHKKRLNYLDAKVLRKYAKKIIYDFDDAVMYGTDTPEYGSASHFFAFRRTVRLADMVIAGNSYLAEHAKRFNNCVEILPTGLDTGEYKNCRVEKKDNKVRLVWIGSRSTLRYLSEIKPALEQIGLRFKNVVLRIICDEFFDLQNMPVEKYIWRKETEVADLVTADIGLAPLPDDRFTRGKCGFKILQYAAAGLPVITSPVGTNREYVRDGITGYYASDVSQWVDKIAELVVNAEKRRHIGRAAKAEVDKFDVNVIGPRLYRLIADCTGITSYSERKVSCSVGISVPQTKTVSICIPTYNQKQYLKGTLNSILEQTYKDYEIIIVDDGSDDGTAEMIKQFDFPLTYYRQQNSGDAAARNRLVDLAKGRYISFIDSDDLLLPDAVERLVKAAEAQPEDIVVYGSYLRIDRDGSICGRCKRKLYSGFITKQLFQTILVHSCGSIFPRKILQNSRKFDASLKVCSDYDLWLQLSTQYKFIALPHPTFKRRRHPGNLSKATFENCLTEFQVLRRFYYEKGGDKFIPRRIAAKILSEKARRAGRYAIREGLYDRASELLAQSFRQYPNLESLIHLTRAVASKRWASF
jgi:glycosyltransferase involved in cell wall biosynthesis